MNHFEKYHNPQCSMKEYVLPFLSQYLILAVCIILHRLFINRGELISPAVIVGDEMSSPTMGRFVFCMGAFVAAVLLAVVASKKAKEGKEYAPFSLGLFAGTFLCNWAGHYVMLGTYPFVASWFAESVWNKSIAYVSGAVLGMAGIYLGVCSAKDRKGRRFASIITYIATGIIAFGMMEG